MDDFTTRQFFAPPKRPRYPLNMNLVGPRFVYITRIYIVAKFCVTHRKTAPKRTCAELFLAGSLLQACSQRRNLKISCKIACMDNSYPFTEA